MKKGTKVERASIKRHKVPEISKDLVGNNGPQRPAFHQVPEFSKNLGGNNGNNLRPDSPVFSIVAISWPTAVENYYEEFENPYGLINSNSFVKR